MIDRIYFFDFTVAQDEVTGEPDAAKQRLLAQLDLKDTFEYEMQKLDADSFTKIEIKKAIKRLQIQAEIVGRRVSDIILANSQAYSLELQRVADFKLLLEDSAQICSISRHSLSMAQSTFIVSALKLIKNQIKRTNLCAVSKATEAIKELAS